MTAMDLSTVRMDHWTIFKDSATLLLGLVVAIAGLRTYAKNARTRRIEFLVELHKAFFVEPTYKRVRQILDDDGSAGVASREQLVVQEPEDFIEFLNLFELVAYLEKCRNLSLDDVTALFGYYLELLLRDKHVHAYVGNPQKGFEHLAALLAKIDSR